MKALPVLAVCLSLGLMSLNVWAQDQNKPIRPEGNDGQPLNLDFETGTLKDWTASGNAFDGQPIRGDTVAPRRAGARSAHQGEFWNGSFEKLGDDITDTL